MKVSQGNRRVNLVASRFFVSFSSAVCKNRPTPVSGPSIRFNKAKPDV